MDYSSLLIFGLKAFIVVVSVLVCIIVPIIVIKKITPSDKIKKKLKLENLKKLYDKYIYQFKQKTLNKKDFKKYLKSLDKNKDIQSKPSLFVLSFNGDVMASQVKNLRDEVSLILKLAEPKDEVALILESRGGAIPHYGLAANQLQRFRDHKIPLTICVDKVAGSGGYLMACVGNQILASPFAFIGSIGVLAGIPNIHELLKKYDIHYEEITAGKYKRTLTPFGKITDEKRERLKQQLNLVHNQFKNFIKKYRNIDLEQTATGEAWLAEEALKKGLIDKLQCSDDYLLEKFKTHNIYKLSLSSPKSFMDKVLDKKKSAETNLLDHFLNKDLII